MPQAPRIGFPRSIYYYWLNPWWTTFSKALGCKIIEVDEARGKLPAMINRFENELCLPIKLFLAQVGQLLEKKIDYLFLPLVGSVDPRVLACPKIIITNDLVKTYYPDIGQRTKLLEPVLFAYQEDDRWKHFEEAATVLAKALDFSTREIHNAVTAAYEAQNKAQQRFLKPGGFLGEKRSRRDRVKKITNAEAPRVLILGHHYTVHNVLLNGNLDTELRRQGAIPVTKEHILKGKPKRNIQDDVGIDVDVWFTEGPEIFHAAKLGASDSTIDAIVYLAMFNCGFDSTIEDVIAKRIVPHLSKPYLHLVLDEHTSKANLVSKLEIFSDIASSSKRQRA